MKIVNLALSAFHHFANENYSRMAGNWFKNEADQISLVKELYLGYNPTRDGAVLTVVPLTAAEVELAVEERNAKWEALKKVTTGIVVKLPGAEKDREINISEGDALIQWEALYTKNGKVIAPKYRSVWAFRRFFVMFIANALAKKVGTKSVEKIVDGKAVFVDEPIQLTTEVPAQLVENMTEKERMFACVLENTKKDVGTKTLDWTDLLTAGHMLYVNGASQADLRRTFKDGTGQKLWYLLSLNNKYTLETGQLLEDLKSGKIKTTKSAMDLKEVYDEGSFADENGLAVPINAENLGKALTADTATKQMSLKDIKKIAAQCNVLIFKDVCNAIANNDITYFQKFTGDTTKVVALNENYAKVK